MENFSDELKNNAENVKKNEFREQIVQNVLKKMIESQTGEKKKKKKNLALIYSKGLTDE